ncbi:MAG: tRNA pseudouridine(55) synthase TruB [bacterium]|nr:tRNA pseudouridine(55) synthase TruB [bacterium]
MSDATGFALVDKEQGWTSHDVVAKARGVFATRKIGHAGTLDPMATGLLVLGLGRATRLLRFITDQPKEYRAVACLGVGTDTLDADGKEVYRREMAVGRGDVATAMSGFVGSIQQTPPMVSAVKVGGRRLHELARRGEEVERPPRTVRVDRLDLENFEPGPFPKVSIRVVGGSGLYVRVLADDIGRALGGRAHLTALRRVRNGLLRVDGARRIGHLVALRTESRLGEGVLPPAEGLTHLPRVEVMGALARAVCNGRYIAPGTDAEPAGGLVRVMSRGRLLAVYRSRGDELVPEVVLG